jgi:gliding motility-associated-like protein
MRHIKIRILLFLIISCAGQFAMAQSVVINKIYNATSIFEGESDAIELLVIQDNLDMRGMIIKDLSLPDTDKDGGGKYKFNNIPLWQNLRSGTTIVIRRLKSDEANYVEDIDASDYTIDVLVTSSAATSTYLTPIQANPGGQHFNITNNDIIIIKADDGSPNGTGVIGAIHAFATGDSNTSTFYTSLQNAGVPILYSSAITGTGSFQYPTNPTKTLADYKGTGTAISTAANKRWGLGFGQNNIDYLESLRVLFVIRAPTLLRGAYIGSSSLKLSWNDNSNNETGFQIEKSLDGVNFAPFATVAANVDNYTATGVSTSAIAYYRVRALNPTNNSRYSNILNTATLATAPIVINKVYNVSSSFDGDADIIELLVIKDKYDLRGLIIKDFSLPDANKDAGGKYKFNDIDLWKSLRAGTTITLRRLRSTTAGYVQDIDPSDFTLDVVLTSTTSNSPYLTPVQANVGGQHLNITTNELVVIKTDDNIAGRTGIAGAIHAFAIGNSNTSTFYTDLQAANVPILYVPNGSGTGTFQYPLNPDQNVSDFDGQKGASSTATNSGLGVGFGQANINYIAALRESVNFPPPSNLIAQVITLNDVKITWEDNTMDEQGFILERSTNAVNYVALVTLNSNVITFIDNTVVAGTKYFYRIRAFKGTKFSLYSNDSEVEAGAGIITAVDFTPITLFENRPIGTLAGNLTFTSPDRNAIITYQLVSGIGSNDNAKFYIDGSQIKTNAILDFETQPNYQIRVKANSQTNFGFEKTLNITIFDVNEAPTLNDVALQNTCAGTDDKVIRLSGISAGPEVNQTLTATIKSNNAALFQSLTINLLANGLGEIRYKLNTSAIGNVRLTIRLKDNGGITNNGIDTLLNDVSLIINPFPTVSISSSNGLTIDRGQTTILTATTGLTYFWDNADGIIGSVNSNTLTVRPSKTTTYKANATNAGGCTAIQEITIIVNTNYDLVVPNNILTPNGDGVNDKWIIQNIDLYPNNEVKIFDGTGRLVYSQIGYNNQWNGMVNNQPLATGTYYFLLNFANGEAIKKGFITLINN